MQTAKTDGRIGFGQTLVCHRLRQPQFRISDQTAVETLIKLLPSIRNDLKKEIDSIGDLKLEFAYKIDEKGAAFRNADELSRFADIAVE